MRASGKRDQLVDVVGEEVAVDMVDPWRVSTRTWRVRASEVSTAFGRKQSTLLTGSQQSWSVDRDEVEMYSAMHPSNFRLMPPIFLYVEIPCIHTK
jgi:hypothetical protein